MMKIEAHRSTETDKAYIEIASRRDRKLVKRALGKYAVQSPKAKTLKHELAPISSKNSIELDKKQAVLAQEALGILATEKGITKFPQRFRARKLNKKLKKAENSLG